GTPGLLPNVQSGKVRIIAVGSTKRLDVLPDVPTVAEQGFPGFESSQWFGLLAPAGTPAAVVNRLNEAAVKALNSELVQLRLKNDSSESMGLGPKPFAAFIVAEGKRWGQVVRSAKLASN